MAIRYINICTIENKAIMNIIIIESENILAVFTWNDYNGFCCSENSMLLLKKSVLDDSSAYTLSEKKYFFGAPDCHK